MALKDEAGLEERNSPGIGHDHSDLDGDERYLLFLLGGERFAAPLLSIKEVIKLPEVKPVPYMVDYFEGVINLRGQVISVIDLRKKFKLKVPEESLNLVLVTEVEEGAIGVVVDDIVSVRPFSSSDIEHNPNIESFVPMDFFLGVGKESNESMVHLINLSGCVGASEMRKMKKNLDVA